MDVRTDPLPLAERLEVEAALDAAFEILRSSRTAVSPVRVRAGVRWGRGAPQAAVPWGGAIARISELSLAAGMSVMVFIGAFGSVPRDAAPAAADAATLDPAMYPTPRVTAPLDDEQYIRWLRLDRFVPLQDWLDPTVVKIGPARTAARLDPPAPTTGRGPF